MGQEMHHGEHTALGVGVGSQQALALREAARVIGDLALEKTQGVGSAESQYA
jgi:hypothetical protein